MVKFSRTEFIMYFSGSCFSFKMKLIMYSHMGDRCNLYRNLPPSNLYSVHLWINVHTRYHVHILFVCTYMCVCICVCVCRIVYLAYSVSTFSTTCFPKLQTLVEHWIVMFSVLSYLQILSIIKVIIKMKIIILMILIVSMYIK